MVEIIHSNSFVRGCKLLPRQETIGKSRRHILQIGNLVSRAKSNFKKLNNFFIWRTTKCWTTQTNFLKCVHCLKLLIIIRIIIIIRIYWLGWELKAYIASAHCSERATYINLKLTASVERTDGGVA